MVEAARRLKYWDKLKYRYRFKECEWLKQREG